jgi:hypothetical protein
MIFTAPGRFESASVTPVAENVEVVAAAGGDRGHSDGDASSRADRKRKPRGKLKLGPVKLVRGGGWCDNCNAASANDQESNGARFGE